MTICFYCPSARLFKNTINIIKYIDIPNTLFLIDFQISKEHLKLLKKNRNLKLVSLANSHNSNVLNIFWKFLKITNSDDNRDRKTKRNFFQIILSFIYYLLKFSHQNKIVDNILKKYKLYKLCIFSDQEIGITSSLINQAKKKDIKIILINCTSSNPAGPLINRFHSKENYSNSKFSIRRFIFKKNYTFFYKDKFFFL